MADGKQRESWNHTSSLMAVVANLFAKTPISPLEFNPFAPEKSSGATKLSIEELKAIL